MKVAAKMQLLDPKKTFESAIAQIQEGGELSARRTPIGLRRKLAITAQTPQALEKQAVAEAAHALATLWRVSATELRGGRNG
jgi:hypothetical protein